MQQKLIQYNFNASAKTYMNSSQVQKISALKIINQLPEYLESGLILDLGSGPGTMQHCPENLSQVILYDLSHKMLKIGTANARGNSVFAINGDAGFLPFATGSIQTVISNLMLQWSEDKLQILKEIKRILTPKGTFMFTTLIPPSLWQLKAAWSKLDSVAHTLDFLSHESYANLLEQSGLKIIYCESWESIVNFTDIYSLMGHFKLTGTTLPKSNMGNGLSGSGLFRRLEAVYSKNQFDKTLPLSYQYLFMIVKP